MEEDEFSSGSRKRKSAPAPTRRSGRAAAIKQSSNKDASAGDSWRIWRGERRSTRLGAPPETQLDDDRAMKRARREDSIASGTSADGSQPSNNGVTNGVKVKKSGAAALKPTEVAVEQIAGKKKSKFWVYAVEPAPGEDMDIDVSTNGNEASNGSLLPNDGKSHKDTMKEALSEDIHLPSSPRPDITGGAESEDPSTRGSLSPSPMDTA